MDSAPSSRRLKKSNRSWIQAFSDGGGPRYLQIARQIVAAVSDGVLRPGDRLPTQRELAQVLGVDLTTVTRAYNEVRESGLLDAHGAGGTFIALSAARSDTSVDLSMNIPPLLGSMGFSTAVGAGLDHVAGMLSRGELMSYHVGAGSLDDRRAGAAWLAPAMGPVDLERLVVCPGAQAALTAVLLAQTQVGDTVAVEQMTYPGMLATARVLQRGVVSIAMDAEGMCPEALERACRTQADGAHPVRAVYLVPTIQNPTTSTLSEERRTALLRVAAKYGLTVIEDDPYWLLAGDAPPPLAVLADSSVPVYYICTLSKSLAPGLRTAYLVTPTKASAQPILDALRAIALMPAQAMVAVATHWIHSGKAQDILGQFRTELAQRQQIARSLLPVGLRAHPNGLHCWLPLPPRSDQYRLLQLAQSQGLGVASADAFTVDEQPENAVRISLGGASDLPALRTALQRLGEILGGDGVTSAPAIV